jgi:Cu2+-exporting ATPase
VAIAAALEQGAAHPIATALRAAGPASITASDVVNVSGEGVEGVVDGKRYRCGRPEWAAGLAPTPTPAAPATSAESMVAALADEAGCIAVFTLDDPLRPGARDLVARLTGLGIDVRLLSGDRAQTVRRVADETGVEHWHADARPGDKVAFIRALQRDGAVVAMIGDGINDAPSLKQADVSIAIGDAATLTRWSADMVALGDDSTPIAAAFDIARRTRRVIRQNLAGRSPTTRSAFPPRRSGS